MEEKAISLNPHEDRTNRRIVFFCALALFAAFTFFLVARHYVKAYSDPVGFLTMAESWGSGRPVMSRAPLYPIMLYGLMQWMGRDWIFLSNVPFLLAMAALLGALSYVVFRRERPCMRGCYIRLGALAAVMLLFLVRRRLLLEMVNPFREPLAFSLVLLAVVLFVIGWGSRRRTWLTGVSGLILGLSVSTRETCLLIAGPMMLWALVEMVVTRRVRWACVGLFLVGLTAGMIPLLHRNYQHTGNVIVPSYTANKMVDVVNVKWDIPVPGMSFEHFGSTGPQTLRKMARAYTPLGVFLLCAGLAAAAVRRNRMIWFLMLPAVLINIFFYSFYLYYKSRYLLVAELFGVPIMAYGAAALVRLADRRLRGRVLVNGVCAAAALVSSGVLVFAGLDNQSRLKIWHLGTLRRELDPHIQRPAVFFGGRHYAYMFSWLLHASYYEFAVNFRDDFIRGQSMDERLRHFGRSLFPMFENGHYYVYDVRVPLCRNWFQFAPVYALKELSVPLDHYGSRVDGTLYEMTPWQDCRAALTLTNTPGRTAMLMLDMRRIWDVPGRTFCHGAVNDSKGEVALYNGVQFIEIGRTADSTGETFYIESDRPVPPAPYHDLIPLNGELDVCFGMAGRSWAFNLMSEAAWKDAVLRTDSCQLYDQCTVLLPCYADTNHEVYAEFRMEFLQEHPYWREGRHYIEATTDYHHEKAMLPPPRRENTVTAGLGVGTGHLRMVPVNLTTTLPAWDVQATRAFRSKTGDPPRGYVKVYDAHIYSIPHTRSYPLTIDVGAERDGPYMEEGFYDREQSGAATARWTRGRAVLQVPMPETDRDLRVRWRCIPARPKMEDLIPRFNVDGTTIPEDRVERSTTDDATIYTFVFSSGELKNAEWNEFTVEVPTWNPERDAGMPDRRDLGLFIDNVVFDHPRN